MNYTDVIISIDPKHPVVHICEVAAENKPGRIVEILTGIEARKHLWQLEKEIADHIELTSQIECKYAKR
jgi:hypothetical protein